MNFLQKLDRMMAERGLNKNTLSAASGIPYTTIDGFYKRGYGNTKLSTLERLSTYFDVALDFWIRDEIDDPNYGKTKGFSLSYQEMKEIEKYRTLDAHGKKMVDLVMDEEAARIKEEATRRTQETEGNDELEVVGFRVSEQSAAAGTGIYLGPESFEIIYVRKDKLPSDAEFGIPVSGDSMEPDYHAGDILLISKELPEIGQVGVFILDGADGYVKELGHGELISLNNRYEPIPLDEEHRTVGKVIGVLDPSWVVE